MLEKTIHRIERYIAVNNDQFGIETGKGDTISLLEIDSKKRMRKEKNVYKAVIGNDPLFIVKFFIDKEKEHVLKNEYENLLLIDKTGLNELACGPIYLKDIDDKKVLIQKYFEGVTIQEVFRKKLINTTSFTARFSNQVFSVIAEIYRNLNSIAIKASRADLLKDLDKLVNNYSKAFYTDKIVEIEKLVNSFIERYPEDEICMRNVLLDAYPCNIIFNLERNRGYLIDLEYAEISTLNFLEPLRAVFFFLKYSYELSNWVFLPHIEEFSNVILRKRIGRLGEFLNDFLRENTVIGRIGDFDFLKTIILIFFMSEALLQKSAAPFQIKNKNQYTQFVDIIASSYNADNLMFLIKEESSKTFIKRTIIRKLFKLFTENDIKNFVRKLMKRIVQITMCYIAVMS